MSAVHTTTPAPAASAAGEGRLPLLRRVAGGTALAATLAAVTIAVWPASETEKARSDGERFGEAVVQLQAADTTSEVDAALVEMDAALADTADHAGDAIYDQAVAQDDALSRAADGFVGMHEADDEFEADLYQYEMEVAADDVADNAEEFRTTGPEVQQAFWDGYQDGLTGS